MISALFAGGAMVAGVGLAAGGYAYAAMVPGSQIFGRTIVAGSDPNELALTYDDGPNDPDTLRLLEVLARHEVKATFFLIGRFVRQRPDIVREIHAQGHLIGNHTQTHPVLLFETPARARAQIAECNAAIEDATGKRVRFFRPPHGARRPDVLRAARELGLEPVMWNAMGYDWQPERAEDVAARVLKGVERNRRRGVGSNILLHDGGQAGIGQDRMHTVKATAMLLEGWKREPELRTVTPAVWVTEASGS